MIKTEPVVAAPFRADTKPIPTKKFGERRARKNRQAIVKYLKTHYAFLLHPVICMQITGSVVLVGKARQELRSNNDAPANGRQSCR